MATMPLDGVTIHYEVDGEGPTVLVLHGGLGVDHTLYRRTLAPLAARRRLVLPDHRGNGRSVPVDLDTVTIEQLADDAAALIAHLGEEQVAVLGHSFGGFVALELALRHPDRLAALVLVSTTPGQLGADEDPEQDQGAPPPPEVLALRATLPSTDQEMADGMARMFPAYFHAPGRLDLRSLHEATIFRAAPMIQGFRSLARWSAFDRLAGIDIPTLVLGGRHDVFTSYPQAHRIAREIPGADVAIFERSGHFPWIEEPEPFFTAVGGWLDEHQRV